MTLPMKYRGFGFALLLGVMAIIVYSILMPPLNQQLLNSIIICAAIYLTFGTLMGLFWRDGNWRWGFWIVAPFWLLIIFSVLFAGIFTKFLTIDVPILITTIIGASLGNYIGARLLPGHISDSHIK